MPAKRIKSKKASSRNLSKKQLENLKIEFDTIDTDHSGQLDTQELATFMEKNGFQPEFANVVIKIFDEDENGEISFEEFINFTNALAKLELDPNLLHRLLFEKLDKDKSGDLYPDEIQAFFGYFSSDPLTKEDVDIIITSYDQNDDKKLSFEEIMQVFHPY